MSYFGFLTLLLVVQSDPNANLSSSVKVYRQAINKLYFAGNPADLKQATEDNGHADTSGARQQQSATSESAFCSNCKAP